MNARRSRRRRRSRAALSDSLTPDAHAWQPYVRKVIEAMKDASPGISHVYVAHDPWCPLLRGIGPCACEPEVTVRDGDAH